VFRKTAGQLLGGAAVLIGAGVAYVQFTEQQRTSREQFLGQQQAARDLLISNQVAKGFELLGHKDKDEITLRLGGIYALEGLMNTSREYHQPVLEALCAFVRDYTKNKADDTPPTTDVQAALTVIGRREAGDGLVDLSGTHISKAFLFQANLSQANLSAANLSGASLGNAQLSNAMLYGANLSGAFLNAANLSHADLSHADLRGAELRGANLTGAFLSDANLSGADMSGAFLSGANLNGADLSGVVLRLARSLVQSQLDIACGDEKTQLDSRTIKPCPKKGSGGGDGRSTPGH
jgi:hypothetical protein